MQQYIRLIIIVLIAVTSAPAFASEMSVAQAYKLQHHKQTTFDKTRANISKQEAKYLDHLFFVTDLAFRERMVMLRYFQNKKDDVYIAQYNKEIEQLLTSFAFISAPNRKLQQVQDIVVLAIKDQQKFFNLWYMARGNAKYNALQSNYRSDRSVLSAHQKLIQAYGMLKQIYPKATSHNTQAFYDHLCALDFI